MLGRIANVILFSLAVVVLTASFSAAQAPNTISYQGRLTDDAGTPITAPTSVTFTIYDAPTGGTSVYDQIETITPDDNGVFTVELGPMGPAVFDGSKRYLGIKVGADAEMTPRQLLTSGPYSLRSDVTPGIAFRESTPANMFRTIPTGTNALDSISITVPAAGFVYVWAHTSISIDHVVGARDEVYFNVDSTAGNINYYDYGFAMIQVPSELPTQSGGYYTYSVDAHRPFFVNSPGTYKFYANCRVYYGDADSDAFFDLQMTAMYFPRAYGAVNKDLAPQGRTTDLPAGTSE